MPKFNQGHAHACLRCTYVWVSKLRKPKACPKCKNYRWDTLADRRQGGAPPKITSKR